MAIDSTELGKKIATASYDRIVRMWSVQEEATDAQEDAQPMIEG